MTEGSDIPGLDDADLLEMYVRMLRIRTFEEAAINRHSKGEIPGALHTSVGQEATAVGACMALTDEDYITGNHRSHSHPIAKGAALDRLMAELMGKETGICEGRGGSMHLADFSIGSLGESGIVASSIPVAVGAGLSAQLRGTQQVTLAFFGDGAANEGAFHESLNLAAIWKLPVIFLCENNGYAVSTAMTDVCAGGSIAARAAAYGIPGASVDGQDVLQVWRCVQDAVDRARHGDGPTLIESLTYRFREHSEMSAGFSWGEYRSSEEVKEWSSRDPIGSFRDWLLRSGRLSAEELDDADHAVGEEVMAAVDFARKSRFPDSDTLLRGVFGE
jgi:acetoin:2,6-dichlorophenolindophenol oxidoreductase subunit alpha